jgi:hypothetical protein
MPPYSTPTIFVPFHEFDDLVRRGTRAQQPLAAEVTPATLYFVTDQNVIERSNGTVWEAYSGSGVPVAPLAHHSSHEPGGSDALVALSASILTTGTLPDARLSTNVQMKPVAQSDVTSLVADLAVRVVGPASSVDNNIALFSGTTGKLVKDSGANLLTYAPLASPAFTGVPTAPTAAPGTNTTQIATTAFVASASATPTAHKATHEAGGNDALTALNAGILTSGNLAFARVQVSAAGRLLGRGDSGAGAMEELTIGAGLGIVGTELRTTGGAGAGDVVGPAVSVVDNLAAYATTSGKVLKDSGVLTANVARRDVANTFAAVNTFTTHTRLESASAMSAALDFFDMSQAVNQRAFRVATGGGQWSITPINDAGQIVSNATSMKDRVGNWSFPQNVTVGGSGGNVACKNQVNVFTQNQYISKVTPTLALYDSSQPADARNFRILNSAQILYFQVTNDAESIEQAVPLRLTRIGDALVGRQLTVTGGGTGNGPTGNLSGEFTGRLRINSGTTFHALEIIGTYQGGTHAAMIFNETAGAVDAKKWRINAFNNGLSFERLADSEGAVINTALRLNADGSTQFIGVLNCSYIVAAGNIHTSAGYLYPGDTVGGGSMQANWFLASHSSYGLWSNTGLYLTQGLWVAGAVTFSNAIWHNSFEGYQRLHFGTAGPTYIKSPTNIVFRVNNVDADGTYVATNGGFTSSWGYSCKPGVYGAVGGNWYNFNWTGVIDCWIDASHMGYITLASDARLKRDFTPLEGSLDKVLRMRPGMFYFLPVKEGEEANPNPQLGLLAQDMQSIVPEIVHNTGMKTPTTPDGCLRVDYLEMIPILVAAIQELERKLHGR